MEAVAGERTIAEIARQYQVSPNMITRWKQEFLEKAPAVFETPSAENNKDKKISEMEKLIGKQTIEIDMLKNFLGHYAGH